MKKILFVASECAPFIKTSVLADVVGELPACFDSSEYDVRVIVPCYTCIPQRYSNDFKYAAHFYLGTGAYINNEYVGVMRYEYRGIKYYFIDNKRYFSGPRPYGDIREDIEKFCFFSKAALSVLPVIGFRPDIIHCHDWQTALIPVYLKTEFSGGEFYRGIKTVLTIHDLRSQGVWDIKTMKGLTGFSDELFLPDKMESNGSANMLKGGIACADMATTISSAYAAEIKTPEFGEGLHDALTARGDSLSGIVNGIDYEIFDPAIDDNIFAKYDINNFWAKKWENKVRLQEQLGLDVDKNKFMIAIISRLTSEKGLDLVERALDSIVDGNTQLVVLGTGERRYEDMIKSAEWNHRGSISANIYYSNELGHRLYAAADAILIPSRREPCGMSQLIALRYGTVPIVRETGGLKDTVEPFNEYENEGLGFSFANYSSNELLDAVNYSRRVYFDMPIKWQQMVLRGMTADYSWKASMEKYKTLYDSLLEQE